MITTRSKANTKQRKLDGIYEISRKVCHMASCLNKLNGVDIFKAVGIVHSSSYYIELEQDFSSSSDNLYYYNVLCYLNGLIPLSVEGSDFASNSQGLLFALEVFEKVRIELGCRGVLLERFFQEKDLYRNLVSYFDSCASDDVCYEPKAEEILNVIRDTNIVDCLPTASEEDVLFVRTIIKDGITEFEISSLNLYLEFGKLVYDSRYKTVKWIGKNYDAYIKKLISRVCREVCARVLASGKYDGNKKCMGFMMLCFDYEFELSETELKELDHEEVGKILSSVKDAISVSVGKDVNISYSGIIPRWKRKSHRCAYLFTIVVHNKDLKLSEGDYRIGTVHLDVIEHMAKIVLNEYLGSKSSSADFSFVFVD